MFKNGCPMCGYSAPPPSSKPSKKTNKKPAWINEDKPEPLPFWTFAITIIVLLVVILILSSLITR